LRCTHQMLKQGKFPMSLLDTAYRCHSDRVRAADDEESLFDFHIAVMFASKRDSSSSGKKHAGLARNDNEGLINTTGLCLRRFSAVTK
jgi:hypothetical protein